MRWISFVPHRYESGPLYKPSSRDFQLSLSDVCEQEQARLRSIWGYWEEAEDGEVSIEEDLAQPDHITTTT
jgi:hypothetical protein